MPENNVTISFSYTVREQDAPFHLQKLLAAFPPGAVTSSSTVRPSAPAWPKISETGGKAYQKRAEDNLQRLEQGHIPDDGWGAVKDLPKVIASLGSEPRKVVLQAIDNGGHISREEVYELLDRDQSRSLNGFTKPVRRLGETLVAKGELSPGFTPLLTPIYQKTNSFQQTQGFAVPVQVVSLMKKSRD